MTDKTNTVSVRLEVSMRWAENNPQLFVDTLQQFQMDYSSTFWAHGIDLSREGFMLLTAAQLDREPKEEAPTVAAPAPAQVRHNTVMLSKVRPREVFKIGETSYLVMVGPESSKGLRTPRVRVSVRRWAGNGTDGLTGWGNAHYLTITDRPVRVITPTPDTDMDGVVTPLMSALCGGDLFRMGPDTFKALSDASSRPSNLRDDPRRIVYMQIARKDDDTGEFGRGYQFSGQDSAVTLLGGVDDV